MDKIRQRTDIEQKFLDLCGKIAAELNLEIYDLEYKNSQSVLTIFVQDPETKTAVIEDCIKIDHALTEHIEELDWMPSELTLEVSSPGMFRDLKEPKHFFAAKGEIVELILLKSLEEFIEGDLPQNVKGKKKLRVKLEDTTEEVVKISIDENMYEINLNLIKKAKLSPPWN